MFQNLSYDFMLSPQTFQYFFRSDILTGFRLLGFFHDFQAVEQHFTHLFGRGNVEFHSGQLVYLFFYLVHPGCKMS